VASLELPECLTFAVLSTAADLATGAAQVAAESKLARALPFVHYLADVRHVIRVREDSGRTAVPAALPLVESSTVVAVGGGRGITAELMVELARVARPRIVVLGSNDLTAHPAGYLDLDDDAFAAARVQYIRSHLQERKGSTPRDAAAAFQRLADARSTRRNLTRIAEHCGPDRVTYRACDITDAAQVTAALAEVGPIDLLVNAAGMNRSAPLSRKDFGEFRRVRDLKVLGYANLRAALADRLPRLWCNFGSLLGFTGQIGEADYASANDFLAAAAVATAAGTGPESAAEITIGWTLWGEVGLGANELTKAYFEKSGLYSAMSTAEGAHHFLRELSLIAPEPLTVHLGAAERAAVERLIPGLLRGDVENPAAPAIGAAIKAPGSTAPAAVTTPAGRPPASRRIGAGHYARQPVSSGPDSATFEHVFDLVNDPYLRHHRVGDVPTLPGTFVAEIAAEAASALVPDQHVVSMRDITFHRFLKVWGPENPAPHRIVASVVDRRPDLGRTEVAVSVLSDVRAGDGRILVKDRLHFQARVILAAQPPVAPLWQAWPTMDERAVPDPYHAAGSPVSLTDMFVSTTQTRLHPWGKRSTYRLALAEGDPAFSRFRVPSILLDGLARTGVLDLVDGDLIPLAAPLSIRRLDIYEPANDLEIAAKYPSVDLYATFDAPPDYTGQSAGRAGGGNRFTAVRPDGRLLVQFQDLEWTLLGFLSAGTGEFLTTEQRGRLVAANAGGQR
jgi:NAD(P)-dependent dehydrogenase (short-subunit alcohol dehydrogenase family)